MRRVERVGNIAAHYFHGHASVWGSDNEVYVMVFDIMYAISNRYVTACRM